jgi:hypothetical protein
MNTDKVIHTGTGWSSLERPRFAPGLLLEDEDLNVGVAYTQGLLRLMFKSFFGCGVVCGLNVSVTPTCANTKRRIDVTRGVALDCAGNLIDVSELWQYELDPECTDDKFPDVVWVVLCYTERCCRKKSAACGDDDGESQPTRIRSGYEITLYKELPPCVCRCFTEADPKDPAHTGSGCGCGQKPTTTKDPAPKPLTKCDCYKPHLDGECGCDCGCTCVVLAKINKIGEIRTKEQLEKLKDPDATPIDVRDDMVRRVRPLLRGYLDCFVATTDPPKATPDPKPGPKTRLEQIEAALADAEADLYAREAAVGKSEAEVSRSKIELELATKRRGELLKQFDEAKAAQAGSSGTT